MYDLTLGEWLSNDQIFLSLWSVLLQCRSRAGWRYYLTTKAVAIWILFFYTYHVRKSISWLWRRGFISLMQLRLYYFCRVSAYVVSIVPQKATIAVTPNICFNRTDCISSCDCNLVLHRRISPRSSQSQRWVVYVWNKVRPNINPTKLFGLFSNKRIMLEPSKLWTKEVW